jgi:hypothetical protein
MKVVYLCPVLPTTIFSFIYPLLKNAGKKRRRKSVSTTIIIIIIAILILKRVTGIFMFSEGTSNLIGF